MGAASLTDNPVKVFATNILLGLAVGIAIALGLNALNTSIRTVEAAEEMTGLSVLERRRTTLLSEKRGSQGKREQAQDALREGEKNAGHESEKVSRRVGEV